MAEFAIGDRVRVCDPFAGISDEPMAGHVTSTEWARIDMTQVQITHPVKHYRAVWFADSCIEHID